MTTGVIVQARMTSKRFPGKSLVDLSGKPVLQHVLERAKRIKKAQLVILACPEHAASAPLYELADKLHVQCAPGAHHNVLERFYKAARLYSLSKIIRITGDCPLFSPVVVDELIKLHDATGCDYSANCFPVRSFPKGFDAEVMSFEALEAAWFQSTTKYEREHVTPWLQVTDGIIRGNLVQKRDESSVNLCVDYPEDIPRLELLMSSVARKKSTPKRLLIH